MLNVGDAAQLINDGVMTPQKTRIRTTAAAGCILAEEILADRAQPPFDRVMMDGIAIAFEAYAAGCRRFLRQGIQAAGARRQKIASNENCIEIMTGAALPVGATAIIPIEQLDMSADHAELLPDCVVDAGQFIHQSGSDYQKDTVLLRPGLRIGGPEMAVLASVGAVEVEVFRQPAISVIAVGDELVDIDKTPAATQIRHSNDYAIVALLACAGFESDLRRKIADDPEQLCNEIEDSLQASDIVVLTGGVSMGKYDHIPAVMQELDVDIILHKVAQRPGKPMWIGQRDSKLVFALPGNPVSALICARRYLIPAVQKSMNFQPPTASVKLAATLDRHPTMTRYVPVQLTQQNEGLLAQPKLPNTSGDFYSLAGTAGFIELGAGSGPCNAGDSVLFWSWSD